MIASPRIATRPWGACFASPGRSRSGTARMVRMFSVMSSPTSPSPRVEPTTSTAPSYTSSTESPSNLGSAM